MKCPYCHHGLVLLRIPGTRAVAQEDCPKCGGEGVLPDQEEHPVKALFRAFLHGITLGLR